jgi:hypothetical protein
LKDLKAGTDEEKAAYSKLADELRNAWPQHLPLHVEALTRAAADVKLPTAEAASDTSGDAIAAAIDAADKVCSPASCMVA